MLGGVSARASSSRPKVVKENSEVKKYIEDIKSESLRYSQHVRPPWQDEDGEIIWDRLRICVGTIILSQYFEVIMGFIIISNIGLMWWETDMDAQCAPTYENIKDCPYSSDHNQFLVFANRALLGIYSVESVARLYVERWGYFYNKWNLLDFSVVMIGWIAMLFQSVNLSMNFLRVCRVVRLVRAARVLLAIRELYMLINGMASSMRTIVYGTFMLMAMLVLWSILVVQLVHPTNAELQEEGKFEGCERCGEGFHTVAATCLTLFQQIIAGDSWGAISVPVIEKDPLIAGPILIAIVLTVSLGLMNLILAVIVERAAEAREQDTQNRAKQMEKDRLKTMIELATICAEMDKDESGTLSLEELLRGYDMSEKFQSLMLIMDVKREDIHTVFDTLSNRHEEEQQEQTAAQSTASSECSEVALSYREFCQHLYRVQTRDVRMMLLELSKEIHQVKTTLLGQAQEHANQLLQVQSRQELMRASIENSLKQLKVKEPGAKEPNHEAKPNNNNGSNGIDASGLPKEYTNEVSDFSGMKQESSLGGPGTPRASALRSPRSVRKAAKGAAAATAAAAQRLGLSAVEVGPPRPAPPPADAAAAAAAVAPAPPPAMRPMPPPSQQRAPVPSTTDRHLGDREEVLGEIGGLRESMRELSVLKADVMRRLAEQTAALSRHLEQLDACSAPLRGGGPPLPPAPPAAAAPPPPSAQRRGRIIVELGAGDQGRGSWQTSGASAGGDSAQGLAANSAEQICAQVEQLRRTAEQQRRCWRLCLDHSSDDEAFLRASGAFVDMVGRLGSAGASPLSAINGFSAATTLAAAKTAEEGVGPPAINGVSMATTPTFAMPTDEGASPPPPSVDGVAAALVATNEAVQATALEACVDSEVGARGGASCEKGAPMVPMINLSALG